ncbi:substrate-binding domain-containing protein [Carnobacterium sp. PL24RED07]|uniref:substrate-binding domain-containing protein n=1 Tax=unclassified Carnobacterium TaxID=257487 RepID=UPI0011EBB90C|nr:MULTISPECIES: substrate-binding domain-containing protein [unclassified Carnobacterium]KAF3299747.1 substrate-binding domain-containing protein [Carnobacterium sp. PL26RED25]KAF3304540.1 substrate-binding domain-containing protein [Carnobacterium sp. PL24RED07]
MKKVVLTLLLPILLLVGCAPAFSLKAPGGADEAVVENMEPAEITVGLSVSTLSNPFFVSLEEGVNTLATENGTQVISVDAQDDSAKQSNDVDDLIQQGVDVLLINPVDSAAITPAVEAANSAGIPVIMVDRATDAGEFVTLVASDNVAGGEMAAQYIVDQVGENASTLQLEGVPGASATNERGEGFMNVAETSLNVLDSQTANFDRAQGLTVMENMLQGNSDVQAVFAQNDEMALGAIEAIEGAGLSNQITVVSFDGTEGGIKAVEDGSLAATIAQQPDEMGRLALQAAYDFYAGQEIPEKIDSPLELVTKD